MFRRRARFHSAPLAKLHIDTQLAIQIIGQHEAESKPSDDSEKRGAYGRRRVRSGVVANMQV